MYRGLYINIADAVFKLQHSALSDSSQYLLRVIVSYLTTFPFSRQLYV